MCTERRRYSYVSGATKVAHHLFDSLATTKDAGMGMGLSICKSIVEAHGGQIEATSLEGKGACFRFSLPRGRGTRAWTRC
ncbi:MULTISPECIES: ATP-binding protein [Paraburkholderia]|uniref:histidine kinase n=1 Tax=Paraburkholderia guartelaensis TaxID=2546446 RepID=A0ABU9S8Z7_9BURK|nr:ATP-binding protein [Paraburkholderia nodosa]